MLTHSLHYLTPTFGPLSDMEDPNVDLYCNFFCWHLLGLSDLMLDGRETVENIHTHTHTVFITYLWGLPYHKQFSGLVQISICTQDSKQTIVEQSELELFTQ